MDAAPVGATVGEDPLVTLYVDIARIVVGVKPGRQDASLEDYR